MKYLVFLTSLVSVCVQADCAERVVDTRIRMQSITGALDRDQSARLTSLLFELCSERDPGSSVIKSSERRVITTQGMKQRPIHVESSDIPVLVDIDVDRARRDRRPGEPRRAE
jgi:hypothetical protein